MDLLVQATLMRGLGITVGGAFSGTAGESSSFRYGFFDRTVNWIEMVLANGDIIKASATENSDLFLGSIGALGTLGVTTLFEIQLMPAKEFVQLMYVPIKSAAEAIIAFKDAMLEQCDFINGILFGPDRGVVMIGRLTERHNCKKRRFNRAHDPWFYPHAEFVGAKEKTILRGCDEETIPLKDYLFRYDRGAFWMGSYSLHSRYTPFNRFTRWLSDPLMRTRKMYQALNASGGSQKFIIQDLTVPSENTEQFLEYLDKDFDIYPLWLCPLRADSQAPMHKIRKDTGFMVNVGVWGPGDTNFDTFRMETRALEQKVQELGGLKWLYAVSYYTEVEFWKIYNREWYDNLRAKYHATTLPNIYDKIKTSDKYQPTSELKGLYKAIFGKNLLLAK